MNRSMCAGIVLVLGTVLSPTSVATVASNIIAQRVTVEPIGGVVNVTLDYTVTSGPTGAAYVNGIGLDKDNDGLIDSAATILAGIPGEQADGAYAPITDVRATLDVLGAGLKVDHGDQIVGQVDVNNEIIESDESDNAVSSDPLHVDIEAVSLTLEASNVATLSYLVDSPGQVEDFDISFYIDDSPPFGVPDLADTLVSVVSVAGTPGAAATVADYSLNIPATGQFFFAVVDSGNAVEEFDDAGNNLAVALNLAGTDLIANSLSYDENSQEATLSYTVDSPTDVAAYNIEFFLDRNDSGVLDAGDSPRVGALVSGEVAPGTYALTQSFASDAPLSSQLVFASLDAAPVSNGDVAETDESGNNLASAQNTDILDVEAISLTYDSNTETASLSYLVNSPVAVDPYVIRFLLDRDGDGIPTGGDVPPVALVLPGNTAPGSYVLTQSYAGADTPASGQFLFAMIDVFDDVAGEDDEGNNDALTTNTASTDLIAVSLAYDPNTQEATLSYIVDAPIGVAAYNIEFGIDTDGSATPSGGDNIVATIPGEVAPGSYTFTQSYAGDPAAAGQYLFAWIDRLPTPNGEVTETDESGNNVATTFNTASLDLEAISLSYDPNSQEATLSYVVRSPIDVAAYDIDFILDSDDSGTISGGDTIVATVAGSIAPGGYALPQSFAGNAPVSNQAVFAQIDVGGVIAEADENNNEAMAANTSQTDLVAIVLSYDYNTEEATLAYVVDSPTDVPAYNIEFFLDRDGDGTLGFGDTPRVALVAGQITPGEHALLQSFGGAAPASGQFIFAVLDSVDDVTEVDEANNEASAQNSETTDLEAVSMSYDSNTQTAMLSYVVSSPIDVTGNSVQFYLETNGTPGLQVAGDTFVFALIGETAPGAHTAIGFYNANPAASNQFVYATIDSADAVVETDENNNVGMAVNNTPTDLDATSLAYDSNTEEAALTYTVNSPINVPAYDIEFFLDRNDSGVLDLGDGPIIATHSGEVSPGSYTLTQSFSGDVPASGQFLFAVIDRVPGPTGAVAETDETYSSNVAATSNTQGTDLVANSLSVLVDNVANETTALASYTVSSPIPVDPFSLKVGIDRDANHVIDGGGSDVLNDILVNNPADLVPGTHIIVVPNFRPALNGLPLLSRIQYGSQIVATLDLNQDGSAAGAVDESEELANNKVAAMPTVDLVANSVAVITDPSAGSTKAKIAYTVDSPGAVEEFTILVGVDRDNNGVIDNPADVLDTIAVTGNKLRPGPRAVTSADFRAALNAVSPALQQGDRIIAALDLLQTNTPVNDVEELEDQANNVVKQMQRVDLVANSIFVTVDTPAGTTEAEVAYTVDSPGSVAEFSLKVGVDRDLDGKIDDPDGLLADVTLSGADLEPGAHTQTVTGLRAALNGLTTPLKNGDEILATLDLVIAGTDEGNVSEDIEKNNNSVGQIQTVDLVANSIFVTVDTLAGTTEAEVAYTVDSPGDVAEFSLKVGVDRDLDGNIDDPDGLLADVTLSGADLETGAHTHTVTGLRAALNGLTTPLKNGDEILATLDLVLAGTDEGNVSEDIEQNNNSVGQIQTVDLVANSIFVTVDTLAGTTEAEVAYTVDSPGSVAEFSLKVGVDRNLDGKIDDPDGLLADVTLSGADLKTGAHTHTVTGLRAALNGLTTPLKNGDEILATLDLVLAGTDEGNVSENIEQNNNSVGQIQTVDLVANSVAVTSDDIGNTTTAAVSYTINSPADVAAFDVLLGVDRDVDDVIDADVSDLLETIAAPDLTPGTHTVTSGNLRPTLEAMATRLAQGDHLLATLDLLQDGTAANEVAEAEELTNNVASEAQGVDLVATAIELYTSPGSGEIKARVNYTVNSPGAVATFNVRVGLDTDNDQVLDPGSVLRTIDVVTEGAAKARPGDRQVVTDDLTADLNALELQNNYRIIATLDLLDVEPYDVGLENNVAESEDVVNNQAREPLAVDLVAIALAFDSNTDIATLSYSVGSIGGLPAYDIDFYLDDNPENGVWDATDTLVDTVAGSQVPGEYTADGDYTTTQVNTSQFIFAVIDLAGIVTELDETNNVAETDNTEITDLVANAISIASDDVAGETLATVSYTIVAPDPSAVPAFDILVGVDRGGDDIIDADPTDLLTTIAAPDLTPGLHQVTTGDLRPALELLAARLGDGDRIIAALDVLQDGTPTNSVEEIGGDETGNNVAGHTELVDLIATAVEVYLSPDSGERIARINYTLNSPGAVAAFNIRVGVDSDADKVIDAGTLLATIDLSTEPAEKLLPGDREVETADLSAALNALVPPLQNGDRLIATLDQFEDGTAEGLVVEVDEAVPTPDNNNFTRIPLTVDLVAQSIFMTVDYSAGTTDATVAYTVNSIGSAAPFTLRIGIDRDGDDLIDGGAGDLLATALLALPDELTPGAHVFESGDIRPALNALAPPIQYGDRIIATLDLDLAGADEGAVTEVTEVGNNVTSTAGTQDQIIDLVATAVEVYKDPGSGERIARISYTINSPGAVAAFNIRVGVDSDADKVIDAGTLLATIDLSTEPAEKLLPGDREVETADLSAALNALVTPLQNGDLLIATLDQFEDGTAEGLVVEVDEAAPTPDNNNFTRIPLTVDLVAQSIFMTVDDSAGTTDAMVAYSVNSIGSAAPFTLRIGVDRDSDDLIDGGAGDLLATALLALPGELTPGAHVFESGDIRPALNALAPPIQYGDRIIATLDLDLAGADEGAVMEVTEVGNNVTSTAGTQDQIIDLFADALHLNIGSYVVTVDYTVTGPGNVAPFVIRIGRDTDADDVIDDPIIDLVGEVEPGAHRAEADIAEALRLLGVLAGETVTIVADVDADNAVVEIDEANNRVVGDADYLVDLVADRLSHPCATLDAGFEVTFDYSVRFNQPGEDFFITLYASVDDDAAISAGDVLLTILEVTDPALKTVGGHTATIADVLVSSADLPSDNFFVKARIDDALTLNESDEDNNVYTRPNAAQDPSEDPDGDGVPNCFDECPDDPFKTSPWACGCGVPDRHSDDDRVPDCLDECPEDPNKLVPGVCGCGVVEDLSDADSDFVFACQDPDDNDPNVPNPQPAPEPQPIPQEESPFDVIWPLAPFLPFPICGIGLCGPGSLMPMGLMIVGFVGLKAQARRGRRR